MKVKIDHYKVLIDLPFWTSENKYYDKVEETLFKIKSVDDVVLDHQCWVLLSCPLRSKPEEWAKKMRDEIEKLLEGIKCQK
jgi:hypothetical protein